VWEKANPGAKARVFGDAMRPEAEASGYPGCAGVVARGFGVPLRCRSLRDDKKEDGIDGEKEDGIAMAKKETVSMTRRRRCK
jgi:hypothetical protein